jgi:hypothetical protein
MRGEKESGNTDISRPGPIRSAIRSYALLTENSRWGGSDDAVPSISESQGDEKVFSYLFGIVNK